MKLIDNDYIEAYLGESWKEQKRYLMKKYQTKYGSKKIKITRIKTDTKGLRNYIVELEEGE